MKFGDAPIGTMFREPYDENEFMEQGKLMIKLDCDHLEAWGEPIDNLAVVIAGDCAGTVWRLEPNTPINVVNSTLT